GVCDGVVRQEQAVPGDGGAALHIKCPTRSHRAGVVHLDRAERTRGAAAEGEASGVAGKSDIKRPAAETGTAVSHRDGAVARGADADRARAAGNSDATG